MYIIFSNNSLDISKIIFKKKESEWRQATVNAGVGSLMYALARPPGKIRKHYEKTSEN